MKAQISLEYLMLSLIGLVLLSVSAYALLDIKEYSEYSSEAAAFRFSAISLSNSINEVCALGKGNSRSVFIHSALLVQTEQHERIMLIVENNNEKFTRMSLCPVVSREVPEGSVIIENEGGVIILKEQ